MTNFYNKPPIKVYVAGDWDHDYDAITQLRTWNHSDKYSLTFSDIHESIKSRDTSLPYSIKRSLAKKMKACDIFILIVGKHTKTLRAGMCSYCSRYLPISASLCGEPMCTTQSRRSISNLSYIQYECEHALKENLKILVCYKSLRVNRNLCPDCLYNVGKHIPLKYAHPSYFTEGTYEGWNYDVIKQCLMRNSYFQK